MFLSMGFLSETKLDWLQGASCVCLRAVVESRCAKKKKTEFARLQINYWPPVAKEWKNRRALSCLTDQDHETLSRLRHITKPPSVM